MFVLIKNDIKHIIQDFKVLYKDTLFVTRHSKLYQYQYWKIFELYQYIYWKIYKRIYYKIKVRMIKRANFNASE
jgi:hypothetical protein